MHLRISDTVFLPIPMAQRNSSKSRDLISTLRSYPTGFCISVRYWRPIRDPDETTLYLPSAANAFRERLASGHA